MLIDYPTFVGVFQDLAPGISLIVL